MYAVVDNIIEFLQKADYSKANAIISQYITSRHVQLANMREDYYDGVHYDRKNILGEGVKTRSGTFLYKPERGEVRLDIVANFIKEVVDITSEHCMGMSHINEEITVSCEGLDEAKSDVLDDFFEETDIDNLAQDVFEDLCKHTKSYIRLRQRTADEITTFSSDYRLEVEDFAAVHPFYDLGNKLTGVMIAFNFDSKKLKSKFDSQLNTTTKSKYSTYAEIWTETECYILIDGKPVETAGNFGNVNQFGFIPFWEVEAGRSNLSDIENIISLQDAVNKSLSSNDIIEHVNAFAMFCFDDNDEKNHEAYAAILEQNSNKIPLKPRSVIPMKLRQIQADGVPQTALQNLADNIERMCTTSGIPTSLLFGSDGGNESGKAKKIRLSRLIKKVNKRRKALTKALKSIVRKVTFLLFKENALAYEIEIGFPPIMEDDEKEKIDAAISKSTIGVSIPTLLKENGYDWEEEIGKQKEYDALKTGTTATIATDTTEIQSELDILTNQQATPQTPAGYEVE